VLKDDWREKDKKYNEKQHRDWCNADNFGITDLGIDPTLLSPSTI